jgi:hypothetical protein
VNTSNLTSDALVVFSGSRGVAGVFPSPSPLPPLDLQVLYYRIPRPIKGKEFVYQLSDYQILRKGCYMQLELSREMPRLW